MFSDNFFWSGILFLIGPAIVMIPNSFRRSLSRNLSRQVVRQGMSGIVMLIWRMFRVIQLAIFQIQMSKGGM